MERFDEFRQKQEFWDKKASPGLQFYGDVSAGFKESIEACWRATHPDIKHLLLSRGIGIAAAASELVYENVCDRKVAGYSSYLDGDVVVYEDTCSKLGDIDGVATPDFWGESILCQPENIYFHEIAHAIDDVAGFCNDPEFRDIALKELDGRDYPTNAVQRGYYTTQEWIEELYADLWAVQNLATMMRTNIITDIHNPDTRYAVFKDLRREYPLSADWIQHNTLSAVTGGVLSFDPVTKIALDAGKSKSASVRLMERLSPDNPDSTLFRVAEYIRSVERDHIDPKLGTSLQCLGHQTRLALAFLFTTGAAEFLSGHPAGMVGMGALGVVGGLTKPGPAQIVSSKAMRKKTYDYSVG